MFSSSVVSVYDLRSVVYFAVVVAMRVEILYWEGEGEVVSGMVEEKGVTEGEKGKGLLRTICQEGLRVKVGFCFL